MFSSVLYEEDLGIMTIIQAEIILKENKELQKFKMAPYSRGNTSCFMTDKKSKGQNLRFQSVRDNKRSFFRGDVISYYIIDKGCIYLKWRHVLNIELSESNGLLMRKLK